jgi:hypothetical protein
MHGGAHGFALAVLAMPKGELDHVVKQLEPVTTRITVGALLHDA